LSLQNLLHHDLELFQGIKSLVTNIYTSSTLLTKLHDLASQANSIGSSSLYTFILDLFLPALETYLRPLHAWMTHGDLDTSIYPDFFITSTVEEHHHHHHHHPIFDLVKDPQDDLVTAPRFMLHIINRVLAAGKTMDFLKRMNSIPNNTCTPAGTIPETRFTPFLQRQLQQGGGLVNPFEQSFENALESWINSKYEVASQILRESIHDDSELWKIVNCVHGVYCMFYYRCMTQFTQLLFQKVMPPPPPARRAET
jgi:gamma-tubulin complex component 5